MKDCFATYEPTDMSEALLRSMSLCRETEQDTADRLGFMYPHQADQNVIRWMQHHKNT